VDIILLDWTRMRHSYCLSGAIVKEGKIRIVRPIPAYSDNSSRGNSGWSPYLMDGHSRWEVFEMVRPVPVLPLAPHLEDVHVQALKPCGQLATMAQRRAILQATLTPPGTPFFGIDLLRSQGGCYYLEPGTGERSLVSVEVPSAEVSFTAVWRDDQPDYRVHLPLPGLSKPILPVKDHPLLCKVEDEPEDLEMRSAYLHGAVCEMGRRVIVRIGLSRSFSPANGQPDRCWLMADGFFSADDPQP
jgi:hypothetical protein